MPAWRLSTASSMARRFCSRPTDRRRGLGVCALSTSAWISTSSGRVPSSVASTQEPATFLLVLRKEQRRRIGDRAQALVGHGEHAQLVDRAETVLHRAHQAEAGMRIALEIEHRVHDVLQHARPGDRALLGDVADDEERGAALLRVARELRGAFAQLRDRPGRRLQRLGPERLDRIHHRDLAAAAHPASRRCARAGFRRSGARRAHPARGAAPASRPVRPIPRRRCRGPC